MSSNAVMFVLAFAVTAGSSQAFGGGLDLDALKQFDQATAVISSKSLSQPSSDAISKGAFKKLYAALSREVRQKVRESVPPPEVWRANDGLTQYRRTALIVRRQLLPAEWPSLVSGSLKAYLQELDVYSDYLSPSEHARYQQAQGRRYAGVGMELDRTADGAYHCYPYPGTAAARAGIRRGDRLLQVNGGSVQARSLIDVGLSIRGPVRTAVHLKVRSRFGFPRAYTLRRERIDAPTVLVRQGLAGTIVQILAFNSRTAPGLEKILAKHRKGRTLTLDLRGCPGGELRSAVACADLFLPAGQPIVYLKRPAGLATISAGSKAIDPVSPMVLWQDDASASAAEVFIAALTQHGRAVSQGPRSHGKTVFQELVPLPAGALFLTTGQMLGPNRQPWQGGLAPTNGP